MRWPVSFHEQLRGQGCPMCAEGRPDETAHGVRYFAGDVSDALLVRADVQRGLSVVVWRGRHVAEPTELTRSEAAAYGAEVLEVGRAIQAAFLPLKLNYTVLGNAVPHLHTHLIPRYDDDPRPGWPFSFPDPDPPAMPELRLLTDRDLLRRALSSGSTDVSGAGCPG